MKKETYTCDICGKEYNTQVITSPNFHETIVSAGMNLGFTQGSTGMSTYEVEYYTKQDICPKCSEPIQKAIRKAINKLK